MRQVSSSGSGSVGSAMVAVGGEAASAVAETHHQAQAERGALGFLEVVEWADAEVQMVPVRAAESARRGVYKSGARRPGKSSG